MGQRWDAPGKITEPATAGLKAFGIDTIPGARVNMTDPPVSERQRKFMGAELARKRAGKKTKTGMTEAQLREYAKKP